jgi:hypothetical protein
VKEFWGKCKKKQRRKPSGKDGNEEEAQTNFLFLFCFFLGDLLFVYTAELRVFHQKNS